jgi:hypothetical protein
MPSKDSEVLLPPDTREIAASVPGGTLFRREGEYWTIVYRGVVLRLRDSKGLRYVAHLLRHPGTRFAARDLMREAEISGRGKFDRQDLLATETSEMQNPAGLSDERARLGVTKRIKAAVKNIAAHHPALGYHLGTAVKTGAYCVYLPDPELSIVWTT